MFQKGRYKIEQIRSHQVTPRNPFRFEEKRPIKGCSIDQLTDGCEVRIILTASLMESSLRVFNP
jgi:hypothetical protein